MDRPPCNCPCCANAFHAARAAEYTARYNPSTFRPDRIKRLWAKHSSQIIASIGRSAAFWVIDQPHMSPALATPPCRVPDAAALAARFEFIYSDRGFPEHTVESFACEGIRVWERVKAR